MSIINTNPKPNNNETILNGGIGNNQQQNFNNGVNQNINNTAYPGYGVNSNQPVNNYNNNQQQPNHDWIDNWEQNNRNRINQLNQQQNGIPYSYDELLNICNKTQEQYTILYNEYIGLCDVNTKLQNILASKNDLERDLRNQIVSYKDTIESLEKRVIDCTKENQKIVEIHREQAEKLNGLIETVNRLNKEMNFERNKRSDLEKKHQEITEKLKDKNKLLSEKNVIIKELKEKQNSLTIVRNYDNANQWLDEKLKEKKMINDPSKVANKEQSAKSETSIPEVEIDYILSQWQKPCFTDEEIETIKADPIVLKIIGKVTSLSNEQNAIFNKVEKTSEEVRKLSMDVGEKPKTTEGFKFDNKDLIIGGLSLGLIFSLLG